MNYLRLSPLQPVGGQDGERPIVQAEDGAEVALVEGKYRIGVVTVAEDEVGGVGEPNFKVSIAFHNLPSLRNIVSRERLEPVRTTLDFVQECQLLLAPDLCLEQVVEFGQYERREHERYAGIPQDVASGCVLVLGRVDGSEQAAGVYNDRTAARRPIGAHAPAMRRLSAHRSRLTLCRVVRLPAGRA